MAWCHSKRGNYLQTPIVVGDLVWGCSNDWVVTCFDRRTGEARYSEKTSCAEQRDPAEEMPRGQDRAAVRRSLSMPRSGPVLGILALRQRAEPLPGQEEELRAAGGRYPRDKNIPNDYPLTENQEIKRQVALSGQAHDNRAEIRTFLRQFNYPVSYRDFETFGMAVPCSTTRSPTKRCPSSSACIRSARPVARPTTIPSWPMAAVIRAASSSNG